MTHLKSAAFCLTGRFLTFLPGEKSPYQMISLDVSPLRAASKSSDGNDLSDKETVNHQTVNYQIVLGKHLRQMMYRYLEPQDWLRVVGQQRMNARSGQLEWTASEVIKLSPHQVSARPQQVTDLSLEISAKPVRVLVCQKSSCHQKGGWAVRRAIEEAIIQAGDSEKFTVQSTGCMKRCKEGPNVVMVPGEKYCRVTVKGARSLIQPPL